MRREIEIGAGKSQAGFPALDVLKNIGEEINAEKPKIDGSREFREAVKDLFPRLWRYCFILAGDRSAADDLAQAACLRALEREHQFQIGTRIDRWIFRIAQTIRLNQLRAAKIRYGCGTSPAEETALADTAADSETALYLSQVLSAVMELPEAKRDVIYLVCVEGYSYRDAADHLGVPPGTIMSRLASARSGLTASLERKPARRAKIDEAKCRNAPDCLRGARCLS